MSAVQALGAARAFGIHLEADGDDLLLEASGPPPNAILDVEHSFGRQAGLVRCSGAGASTIFSHARQAGPGSV